MVDASSILIWSLAVGVFVLTCVPRLNTLPLYSLCTIMGAGGVVCALNEYNAGGLDNPTSLVMIVVMVAIMLYSLFGTIMELTPMLGNPNKWMK